MSAMSDKMRVRDSLIRQLHDHFKTHSLAVVLNDGPGETHIRESIHTLVDSVLDQTIDLINESRKTS